MNESLTPQEVAALKREVLSSLHCAMPGIVESFDADTQTASVRPVLKRNGILLPLIRDVPVFFPGTRESAVTWPVSAGDECLLVFADFDIDRWFESGEAEEASSGRAHALPDAFAFVGFRSRPNALRDFSSDPSFFGGGGGGVQIDDTAGEGDTGVALSADRITRELAGKSDTGHDHDGRYYTEAETDTKLSGKKNTQAAVSDPAASGTAAAFIASVSQNAQGVITPTKKTVRTFTKSGSSAASGLVPAPPAAAGTTKFLCEDATWKTALTSHQDISGKMNKPASFSIPASGSKTFNIGNSYRGVFFIIGGTAAAQDVITVYSTTSGSVAYQKMGSSANLTVTTGTGTIRIANANTYAQSCYVMTFSGSVS